MRRTTTYLLYSTLLHVVHAICGFDARQIVPIDDSLAIAICSSRVARIFRTSDDASSATNQLRVRPSLTVQPGYADKCCDVSFNVTSIGNSTIIQTSHLRLEVDRSAGYNSTSGQTISFYSQITGKLLTAEVSSEFTRISNKSTALQNSQSWALSPDEALYGGGQYVNGLINYASAPLLMTQFNTEAVVPFFTSSRMYGLLWDHYGLTKLNPLGDDSEIILEGDGTALWTPPSSGDYWINVIFCKDETEFGAGYGKTFGIYLDEELVCKYKLTNMPCSVACRVNDIVKDSYAYSIKVDTNVDTPRLFYNPIGAENASTTLSTKHSNVIDYYFIIGDETKEENVLDSIISSYREITGTSPLYAKSAYGFWQCKERYHNQTELLQAAIRFRELQIPVDNFVQDWMYWGGLGWGPQWDKKLYPSPDKMITGLQKLGINFMVSVWSRFDEKTNFYQAMKAKGLLIPNSTWFDPWNPAAREQFFLYARENHFDISADYLWLDATEPEDYPHKNQQIHLGDGNAYWNTYSLQVSKAIYDGLRNLDSRRRIFSLTRSSFAGQQRYGASLWSGDVLATWDSLRRQIAMSINYAISGMPTWSMDTGGFRRPYDNQYTSPDYALLLTRWFQFSVFTPIFRTHGLETDTELWNYGNETMGNIVSSAIHLRYRLLDYIYACFAMVERDHYTVQRGLVMDFLHDANVYSIADEFMFGPSLLVAPLYSPSNGRDVYLPDLGENGETWRNFYSGEVVPSGWHTLSGLTTAETALFVRSSILVMGPIRQHAFEVVDNNAFEIRIYGGANSSFVLYQDGGVDASPDRPHCEITFVWNDETATLVIDEVMGHKLELIFAPVKMNVVLVSPGHGIGVYPSTPDVTVTYTGTKMAIPLGPNVRGISVE